MNEAIAPIAVQYPLTLAQIETQLAPLLNAEKPADVVKAIATCRGLRVDVEERRKLLKADSLDYGRRVDEAARQLTAAIVKYEEPLKQRKAEHDEAKARAKRDAEQAERERLLAAEREQMAKERAAAEEEAKVQAQRLRIEAQQLEQRRELMRREKEEAQRELEEERRKMAAERAETQRILAQAEQERKSAQATLDRIEREKEQERTRARMAAEAEEQRLAKERHDRELAAKVAAAQPDIVKLRAWADRLSAIRMQAPSCTDPDARTLVLEVQEGLERLAGHLIAFDGSPIEYSDAPVHQSFGGEVVNVNEH